MRENRKQWGNQSALVVLLAAVLVGGCRGPAVEDAPGRRADRTAAVDVVEMVPRDLSGHIRVTGTLQPLREIRVASRMAGILDAVLVEEGAYVKAGELLARLDVAEHQAELRRAQAAFQRAEAYYERVRRLQDGQLVSADEYDEARAAMLVAEGNVQLWQTRVGFGRITAPAEGVIIRKRVEAGDAVGTGEVLFALADVSALLLRAGVSDIHAARLDAGQPVALQVDAHPGRTYPATLRRVFPAADPDTGLVPVEVAVEAADAEGLRLGYLARAELLVDPRNGVTAVPETALRASTPEEPFVFVLEDLRVARRNVETGVTRRGWTEIRDGLSMGETVVASNPSALRNGMTVRIAQRIHHPSEPPFAETASE
jgi:membrane fusion protein, multidrug efflux system